MYISKINIQNYRNFMELDIDFNEGMNVIIGHNNTGKSNLIKALSLIFDSNVKRRLDVNDFNKHIKLEDLKKSPPKISITVTISQSKEESLNFNDLAIIGDWLIRLEEPYEAQLTYEYFLPKEQHEFYKKLVSTVTTKEELWKIIEDEFIRLYTYKVLGGNPVNQVVADRELLRKFDFQFLDAIRDVERDMFTGKDTLLKNIFEFFMDYDIKSDNQMSREEKITKIKEKKYKFSHKATDLLSVLHERMKDGKEEILEYVNDIGASFDNSRPNFEGNITDVELYSALKLIVEYGKEVKIPISHNGLGYNNLIFMSLLLSKMQVNADGEYLGSNVKAFPILAIEEPEAHLHPTMQYQFLKFLKDNRKKNKVRQIFITTHSTHIVASISLDHIICLYKNKGKTDVAYPHKALFEKKSKSYVQRFLDATKSDMLFAESLILVEGITEQLLLSIFAQYLDLSLEENHVAVINIGGRYFKHFLYLFDGNKPHAMCKKVVCLTDIDPLRKRKSNDNRNSRFETCYPFEYGIDKGKYEYKQNTDLEDWVGDDHPNIRIFTQSKKYGKTFEYDLALANPSLELLLTDSISNSNELRKLMDGYAKNKTFDELTNIMNITKENKRIIKSLEKRSKDWDEDDKKKALIASRYLNSVRKGENALELAYNLQENLKYKGEPEYQEFNVPTYIENAIKWVCE